MSQLFELGGQSIGVSASTSVLPMNTHDWFPLGWTCWIYLQSKGLRSLLQHHSSKASLLQCSAFFTVQLSHPYMTTGKTIGLTRRTFVDKVMSLLMIFWMRNLGRALLYGLFLIQWHQLGHLLENSLWKWFYYLHVWCLCTFWLLYLLVSLHIESLLGSFHMMWTSYSMASQYDETSNMTVYLPQSEHYHEKLQGSLWPSFSSPRMLLSSHSTGQANHSDWPKRSFRMEGRIDSISQKGNDMDRLGREGIGGDHLRDKSWAKFKIRCF